MPLERSAKRQAREGRGDILLRERMVSAKYRLFRVQSSVNLEYRADTSLVVLIICFTNNGRVM